MRCGTCGSENRPAAVFCAGCGARLAVACGACGADLDAGARYCDQCGTPTAPSTPFAVRDPTGSGRTPSSEATGSSPGSPEGVAPVGDRKVVTVVFADLSGSTSLQERLDAEATARLMERVHRVLAAAVEEHGGRVVKSTGDGVMAVFGVPVLREDDAVRAVRAAVAMQDGFAGLGLPDVSLRVGVNTGEVVVAPGSDDVVGDPVNVAARLEAAAPLGEVLLGPETIRLTRDAVALEPVDPLVLKGKAEPVRAARVLGVARAPAPTTATRFLGRDADLAALLGILDDAMATASARLVTVIGWPGLGKSRLAAELASAASDRATIVEVRFVADGGSSFGPMAEALAAGAEGDDLDVGADAARVAETIDALVDGRPAGSTEQVFWAIRRRLEALADRSPVVVVLDDLHWAEPAMLDLVEHLAEWLRGGPVLLLALARPELRDRRPRLLEAGGPSAAVVVLAGLDADACRALAHEVVGAAALPAGVVERAYEASEGNPLFLRELLRLLVDDGVIQRDERGGWTLTVELDAIELPATIHAALGARIEQLDPDERQVLQAASVIGRHFARGALAALLPPEVARGLDDRLASLHRRALVDPEGTWWADEPMFRFHHVLIRDAAYRRVLKEVRAQQHVRYADWLAVRDGEDEVLGFHLEQAVLYRRELGEPVEASLVARAVGHLGAAGRRALDGDDLANAASLLARALVLDPGDLELLRDRCEAVVGGGDAASAAEAVTALAAAARDDRDRAVAEVFAAQLEAQRAPGALAEVAARASAAAAVLAAHGDDVGVAHAEAVQAAALADLGQIAACEAALDRSLSAARRAGDTRRANAVLALAPAASLWGPSPISRACARCLDTVRVLHLTGWAPHVEAHAQRNLAVLEALRDRTEPSHRMLASARQTFTDLGHHLGLLETSMHEGLVDLLDGQLDAAETALRTAVDGFAAMGAVRNQARATALLARVLLELGRIEEASALADPGIAGADLKSAIGLLGVAAEIAARTGDLAAAESMARRASAIAGSSDLLVDEADARLVLARVLRAAGRDPEARAELVEARARYEQKGATAGLRRASDTGDTGEVDTGGPGAGEPPAGASPNTPPTVRRVGANRATALVERFAELGRSGPVEALDDLYADDCTIVSHAALEQIEMPVEEMRRIARRLSVGSPDSGTELVAALGDRHCLITQHWRLVPGSGGVIDDVGLLDIVRRSVARVGEGGRFTRIELFEEVDLARAVARLHELWAEDELDGAAREAAMVRARSFAWPAAIRAQDADVITELLAPDAVHVDHHTAGPGEVVGAAEIAAWTASMEASVVEVTDVLGCDERRWLLMNVVSGEVGGASYEMPAVAVILSGPDGRIERIETFPPERMDDAWACFDDMGRQRRDR